MIKRNSIRAGVIAIVLALASAGSALADAHGNASCLGFEASGVAPPGSSDEFPGGVAELQAFLKDEFGRPTGAIVSAAAKQHLGSHEACDAGEEEVSS
jgi:ABC-type phosphate/phosphonate transport system substrate-binding protein